MTARKRYYYYNPSTRLDRDSRADRAVAIYTRAPWVPSTEIAGIVGLSADYVRQLLQERLGLNRPGGGPGETELSFTEAEMGRLNRFLKEHNEIVEPGELGFEEER